LLWTGQAISTFGDALYDVALLFYVFDTTRSAFAASGIAVAATAGRLLASVPAAAVADRVPVRRLMLLADGGRLAVTLGVSAAWIHGTVISLPLLYALACLVAAGGAVFDPARAVAVAEILPADHLVVGNALEGLLASLTLTLTWALGGVIVAAVGPATALFLDAGTFLVSFCLIVAARWTGHRHAIEQRSSVKPVCTALAEIRAGIRWVRDDRLVRHMLVAQGAYMLAAAFFFTGLVPFLQYHLHGGAALYGLQGAVFGAGLVLSSWLIGLRPLRRIGQVYCLGLVVNGVGNSLFALAPSVWYLLPAVFLAGLGRAGHAIGERTILQTRVLPEVRGRVFVLWGTVAPILWAPALPLGGWLSDHASAQAVLLSASLAHVGIGLWLQTTASVRQAQVW
jgi:DHA3 family tetracycline resistance protein-like MFS transporter